MCFSFIAFSCATGVILKHVRLIQPSNLLEGVFNNIGYSLTSSPFTHQLFCELKIKRKIKPSFTCFQWIEYFGFNWMRFRPVMLLVGDFFLAEKFFMEDRNTIWWFCCCCWFSKLIVACLWSLPQTNFGKVSKFQKVFFGKKKLGKV